MTFSSLYRVTGRFSSLVVHLNLVQDLEGYNFPKFEQNQIGEYGRPHVTFGDLCRVTGRFPSLVVRLNLVQDLEGYNFPKFEPIPRYCLCYQS